MADNNPKGDDNKFFLAEKEAVLIAVFIVLGLLIFILVSYIQNLPIYIPVQRAALENPQNMPVRQDAPPPVASPSAINPQGVAVGFLVSGRITQMFFVEHAEVKQGDLLALLDKAPFENMQAAAEAQLQATQVDYNNSSRLPAANFNIIEAAKATVESAQHTYDNASAELEKRRSFMVAGEKDNVYDDDVQNVHDAELNLEKAHRELMQQEEIAAAKQQELIANNTDLGEKKSAMQAAQNNIAIAETNLAATQLRAPADGIIVSRDSDIGATVSAGTAVYTLSPHAAAVTNP